jgi:hypothetical protein
VLAVTPLGLDEGQPAAGDAAGRSAQLGFRPSARPSGFAGNGDHLVQAGATARVVTIRKLSNYLTPDQATRFRSAFGGRGAPAMTHYHGTFGHDHLGGDAPYDHPPAPEPTPAG